MPQAIAIAATPEKNALRAALDSFTDFSVTAIDFMYGTPERARFTYSFAIAMALFGAVLSAHETQLAMSSCSYDALAKL